jgi:hypothetical protein
MKIALIRRAISGMLGLILISFPSFLTSCAPTNGAKPDKGFKIQWFNMSAKTNNKCPYLVNEYELTCKIINWEEMNTGWTFYSEGDILTHPSIDVIGGRHCEFTPVCVIHKEKTIFFNWKEFSRLNNIIRKSEDFRTGPHYNKMGIFMGVVTDNGKISAVISNVTFKDPKKREMIIVINKERYQYIKQQIALWIGPFQDRSLQ